MFRNIYWLVPLEALDNGFLSSFTPIVHKILILTIRPKYWFSELDNRQFILRVSYRFWIS